MAYAGARKALQIAQETTELPGSCTACVAVLDNTHQQLQVAVVGDSAVRVIRAGQVIAATKAQDHSFNMPYQIAWPDFLADTDMVQDAAAVYKVSFFCLFLFDFFRELRERGVKMYNTLTCFVSTYAESVTHKQGPPLYVCCLKKALVPQGSSGHVASIPVPVSLIEHIELTDMIFSIMLFCNAPPC